MKMINTENKFITAHNELIDLCNECRSKKDIQCQGFNGNCAIFTYKLKRLYYIRLYPFHPCKKCLVRPACDSKEGCPEYEKYDFMRTIADSEVGFFRDKIDHEYEAKCILKIKRKPIYYNFLNDSWQYMEYCEEIRSQYSYISFASEFY